MRTTATAAPLLLLLFCSACGSESGKNDPTVPGVDSEVQLEPPADGFQIETESFEVPWGDEIQDCYFYEVPYDEPVYVNRITIAQNEGSHHMNLFRVRSIVELDGEPGEVVRGGECWESVNWSDWPLLINTQKGGNTDWELPDGVSHRLEPGEKLMIQTHYVNTSVQDTPLGGKVLVNFHRAEPEQVQHEIGTIFATNQNIRVCPGESGKKYEASCKMGIEEEVTIIGANGHFHERGDRFTISTWDEFDGAGDVFYESLTWDDPPMRRDLNVKISPGGGISWTCEFSAPQDSCGDPEDDCCFTFGGFVDFQEHCNAFAYYYPRGNTDINCF